MTIWMTWIIFGLIAFISFLILVGYLNYLYQKNRCHHKWNKIERIEGRTVGGWIKTIFVLQCEKCGEITKRKTD